MKQFVLWFLIYVPIGLYAQSEQNTGVDDSKYLEDQFYAGITYNFILNLPQEPNEANQRNLSYGLQAGFIKDLPFNSERTVGLGIGLGLGLYTSYTNIQAFENDGDILYQLVDDNLEGFKRSKIETHILEVPIEFRWRNSDSTTYSFWRIYAGVKLGYAFNSRSKFVLENQKTSFKNNDVRDFQYGLTFNFGYHNFNIHAYYSLTNLFNDNVILDGNAIEFKPLRIGLIFYFL